MHYFNTLVPLRFTLLMLSLVAAGCGDGDSQKPDGGHAPDGGSIADGSTPAGDAVQQQGFDFKLTIKTLSAAGPWKTPLFVAVRDAESGDLVAFFAEEEGSSFTVSKAGLLLPGRSYRVGMLADQYAKCLLHGSTVWYQEIAPVSDHVTLSRDLRYGEGADPRGCEVLHVPVGLSPGTYTHSEALFQPGDRIALVVSASGRLYAKSQFVLCADPSSATCKSSLLTATRTCKAPITPEPEVSEVELYNAGGNMAGGTGDDSELRAVATLDAQSGKIGVVGYTKSWKGSEVCCNKEIKTTLVKTSDEIADCP